MWTASFSSMNNSRLETKLWWWRMFWICACLSTSNKYKSVMDHKQIILSSPSQSLRSSLQCLASPILRFFPDTKCFCSGCITPSPSAGFVLLDDISNRVSPRLEHPTTDTIHCQPGQPLLISNSKFPSLLSLQLFARNISLPEFVKSRCYGPRATAKSTAPASAADPCQHAYSSRPVLPGS